jgi:hypothetical protein
MPVKINKQISLVLEKHKGLSYDEKSNMLHGKLEVDEEDVYHVEIYLIGFPRQFAKVREVGERIPRKIDRHVYSSGNCCLTTIVKEQILLKTKVRDLLSFMTEIVVPFFRNNSYYEALGKYYKGEYSHGTPGVFESYCEILGLDSLVQVRAAMKLRLDNRKFERNEACFCESGIKIKNCHLRNLEALSFVDEALIKSDLKSFENL